MLRSIQRFEVIAELGTGAMGVVYRARDPQLEREVAIKLLSRAQPAAKRTLSSHETVDLRGDAPTSELLAEARMMAKLSHPNVLPVYEVGLWGDEMFVVMEHIAGSDMRTWLATERSLRERLDVLEQAAHGLAAAHAHAIVHGDFKPDNVLVGSDGRVRVADFGLSRLMVRSPLLRVERAVGGTPFYMAPELFKGAASSERTDVFAYCTTVQEVIGDPRGMPPRLRTLVADGLADDPAKRPRLVEIIEAFRTRRGWKLPLVVTATAATVVTAAVALRGEPSCAADRVRLPPNRNVPGLGREIAAARSELANALQDTCAAERAGELTDAQAWARASCIARRGFELDAMTTTLANQATRASAIEQLASLPSGAECRELVSAPLAREAATLWARLPAATLAELDALERDAQAAGESELVMRVVFARAVKQFGADQLAAADTSLGRAYDLAVALRAQRYVAAVLVRRVMTADGQQDLPAAKLYAKLALEIADKPTTPARERANVYFALGFAEAARGEPSAPARLEKALAILADDGRRHPSIELRIKNSMVQALLSREDGHVRALALAKENLEFARTQLGDFPDFGVQLNIVAWALRVNNDPKAALPYRQRALEAFAQAYPPYHSRVILQRLNVALDLSALGRFVESRTEMEKTIVAAGQNETLHAQWPALQANLAAIIFHGGALEEGLAKFERALTEVAVQQGATHPVVLRYQLQRIELELHAKRFDSAVRHLDELEQAHRKLADQELPLARLDGVYRAQIAIERKQPRDAEKRTRAALATWDELNGDAADRVDLLKTLGWSLLEQQRHVEALDAFERAHALSIEKAERDDRQAELDVYRAKTLRAIGRRDEARELARAAAEVLKQYPLAAEHVRAAAAISR